MALKGKQTGPSLKQRQHRCSKHCAVIKTDRGANDFRHVMARNDPKYADVDVDPSNFTPARPESKEKVRMITARYASRSPLVIIQTTRTSIVSDWSQGVDDR